MAQPKEAPIPNPFEQPGLTEEVLRDVLRTGEARRNLATKLDAPTRGGTDAFYDKIHSARVILIPFGWTYSNKNNFCTVISPNGKHAIAVVRGSKGTGDLSAKLETGRKMGPMTVAIVAENQAQCSFFFAAAKPKDAAPLTWLLLWRRVGDLVQAELSLPQTENNGYVVGWKQRYPLRDIPMAPPSVGDGSGDSGGNDDDDSAYDVDVQRRG